MCNAGTWLQVQQALYTRITPCEDMEHGATTLWCLEHLKALGFFSSMVGSWDLIIMFFACYWLKPSLWDACSYKKNYWILFQSCITLWFSIFRHILKHHIVLFFSMPSILLSLPLYKSLFWIPVILVENSYNIFWLRFPISQILPILPTHHTPCSFSLFLENKHTKNLENKLSF